MQLTRIIELRNLSREALRIAKEGEKESAKVWNLCSNLHRERREQGGLWPNRDELQKVTKGRFSLHSQSAQMVCHAFLANVQTTQEVRKTRPWIRYPYKEKHFYPLMWPKQAMRWEEGRLRLPMGRGRKDLILKIEKPEAECGGCKLIWAGNAYQLHLATEVAEAPRSTGPIIAATCDLGEIHMGALVIETGEAFVVSGRGLRDLKRFRAQSIGQIQALQKRCISQSRRWKKLQVAKERIKRRSKKRIRDLRHKGTSQIIQRCKVAQVTDLYVGNPTGVRNQNRGRHHNQRMHLWEAGKDLAYLEHKARKAGISFTSGTERGTSSCCPECGFKKKVTGRMWVCPHCYFKEHRDVVGGMNMFPLGFGRRIRRPTRITYLRPGPLRRTASSSSLDTGQSCLAEFDAHNQRDFSRVPLGTGQGLESPLEALPL